MTSEPPSTDDIEGCRDWMIELLDQKYQVGQIMLPSSPRPARYPHPEVPVWPVPNVGNSITVLMRLWVLHEIFQWATEYSRTLHRFLPMTTECVEVHTMVCESIVRMQYLLFDLRNIVDEYDENDVLLMNSRANG